MDHSGNRLRSRGEKWAIYGLFFLAAFYAFSSHAGDFSGYQPDLSWFHLPEQPKHFESFQIKYEGKKYFYEKGVSHGGVFSQRAFPFRRVSLKGEAPFVSLLAREKGQDEKTQSIDWLALTSQNINPRYPLWVAHFLLEESDIPLSGKVPAGSGIRLMVIPTDAYQVKYFPGEYFRDQKEIPQADREQGVVAVHNSGFHLKHVQAILSHGGELRRVSGGMYHRDYPRKGKMLGTGFASAIIERNGEFRIVRWSQAAKNEFAGRIHVIRQSGFPLLLQGRITPETAQWKKQPYTSPENLIMRSYLGVTDGGEYIVYAYTYLLDPLQAAQLLLTLGVKDAMLLDVHQNLHAYIDQTPPRTGVKQNLAELLFAYPTETIRMGSGTSLLGSRSEPWNLRFKRGTFYYVRRGPNGALMAVGETP